MTLEATEARVTMMNDCKKTPMESCSSCLHRYACEDLFPVVDHGEGHDILPYQYELGDDGLLHGTGRYLP